MFPKLLVGLLLALLTLGAVACGDDEAATPEPWAQATDGEETPAELPASGTVEIHATEYAFDVPLTLPAGPTTFTLINTGAEKHFIEILELKADAPPASELVKIRKADKYFVRRVGGTKPVAPGATSEPFEGELTPGRYGYACFIETKDGKPHAFLGMVGEFTVQ